MPSLSLFMIVKNEERCLADCLDSVRGIVDEMVIADTGSTDGTVAIAQRYGAMVFSLPWADDFAAARNACMAKATGDWLLMLDADEALDAAGARRVRELADRDGAGADVIEVIQANYVDASASWRWVVCDPNAPLARGHAGYVAVPAHRMFRNRRGYYYRGRIHEVIEESVRAQGGRIRREAVLVHHYGYRSGLDGGDAKVQLYLAIGRRKAAENPNDAKAWYEIGACLQGSDEPECEEALRRAVRLAPAFPDAAIALTDLLFKRGDMAGVRNALAPLSKSEPVGSQVKLRLAHVAMFEGDMKTARRMLEAVLAASPRLVVARLSLARVLDLLDDQDGVRAQLDQAAAIASTATEVRKRIEAFHARVEGEAAFCEGDILGALRLFAAGLEADPFDHVLHNDAGVAQNALGDSASARACFERALALVPWFHSAQVNLEAIKPGELASEQENTNTREYWNTVWKAEGADTWRQYPTCFHMVCQVIGAGKRVLDVGCGLGVLAAQIRDAGNVVYGLDISDAAVRAMRAAHGIHGVAAQAPYIPFASQSVDVAVATEFLEHFQHPGAVLAELARVGRVVIVSVPNNLLGHEDINEHYQRFTVASLRALMGQFFTQVELAEFLDDFVTSAGRVTLPTLLAVGVNA